MREPTCCKPSAVRYYCTAGNGMEQFLVQEVKSKLAAEDVCQLTGKVLFSTSAGIDRVRELKSAERLFLLLRQDLPVKLPGNFSSAKAASELRSRLVGDATEWTSAIMTWSRLQGVLDCRGTSVVSHNIATGLTKGKCEEKRWSDRKVDEMEYQSGDAECRMRKREWEHGESVVDGAKGTERKNEKVSGVDKSCSDGQKESWKRRREEDEEEKLTDSKREEGEGGIHHPGEQQHGEKACSVAQKGPCTPECQRKRDNDEGGGEASRMKIEQNSGKENETSEVKGNREEEEKGTKERNEVEELSGDRQSRNHATVTAALCDCSEEPDSHNHTTTPLRDHRSKSKYRDSLEHVEATDSKERELQEPSRDKLLQPSPTEPVTFRISCKCSGALARWFSTQELSGLIGSGISRLLGWKVDLRNPKLEVNVYLSDDHCLLGIPLTRLPLANRSYIKTTGLRSTVAWAMGSLAQIQPGFCVLDPMCGVGTILLEAAQEQKDAFFLGMDIDDRQLQKANENIAFANLADRVHLLKASTMELPLASGSVDAVLCDLPFGRQFDTKENMAAKLIHIVTEMERVLCVGGVLVLLLSPQLSCLLKKLQAHPSAYPTPIQETVPLTGQQRCSSSLLSSLKPETCQTNPDVTPPCIQGTEIQSESLSSQTGLQQVPDPPLSSLKHQASYRVSLGAIDGLIQKYVKL